VRRDGSPTPPDKTRRQGVDTKRPLYVNHTEESRANLAALKARWGLSDADTVRRALREAARATAGSKPAQGL
jgi:hypothetical protein